MTWLILIVAIAIQIWLFIGLVRHSARLDAEREASWDEVQRSYRGQK